MTTLTEHDIYVPMLVRTDNGMVQITPAGEVARIKHGYRYGAQTVALTPEHINALIKGNQLAINILDEYVLFLHYDNKTVKTPTGSRSSVFDKIRRGLCEAIIYERKTKSTEYKLNSNSENIVYNTTV